MSKDITRMQASDNCIDLIKEFEGLALEAYEVKLPNGTTDGKITIGYGHTSGVKLGTTITEDEAVELLKDDLRYSEMHLNNICQATNTTLNQNQFDALVSFVFNIGSLPNEMKERLETDNLEEVGNSLTLYCKSNGVALDGLLRRRKAEQQLFFKEI